MRLKIAGGYVLFLIELISPLTIRSFHIKKIWISDYFGFWENPTHTAAGNRKAELSGHCRLLPQGSCHNPNMIKDPLPLPQWSHAQLRKTQTCHAGPRFGSMLTWLPSPWDASVHRASLMGRCKQSFQDSVQMPLTPWNPFRYLWEN